MTQLGEQVGDVRLNHITQFDTYKQNNTYTNSYWFTVGDETISIPGSMSFSSPEDVAQGTLFEIVPDAREDISEMNLKGQIEAASKDADWSRQSARTVTQMLGGLGVISASVESAFAISAAREDPIDTADVAVAGAGAVLALAVSAGAAIYFRRRELRDSKKYNARAVRFQKIYDYLGFDLAKSTHSEF